MWNYPSDKQLDKIPAMYATEKIPLKDKIVHMHFFIGGSDWYATEYSKEDRLFFGYAILNNDEQNAEWGYFSLDELADIKLGFVEIDRDRCWTPCKASEVAKIVNSGGIS